MKMVMGKSWKSHEILLSVMELYKIAPRIVPNLYFLATTKKLSSDLECLHFPKFSTKRHECKIRKRDGHGKSRDCHGKVMEKPWKNMF